MVNDSYVYEVSKRTLRPSAVSSPALSTRHAAMGAVPGLEFKGRALKGLYLNAVKDKECKEINGTNGNYAEKNGEKEEKVRAPLWKSAEKVCVKKRYQYRYEEEHQSLVHQHQKEYQHQGQQHASSRLRGQKAIISKPSSSAFKKARPTMKDDVKHTTQSNPLKRLPDVGT